LEEKKSMLSNLKLSRKIGLGFSVVLLIAVALGGMALWNMRSVSVQSGILAREYVPEVEVAGQIHCAAHRLMQNMSSYGFTEDQTHYTLADKDLQSMDDALSDAGKLLESSTHLKQLDRELEAIRTARAHYSDAMKRTVATVGELEGFRARLDTEAKRYMENCEEFVAAQDEQFKADLAERQEKISLASELARIGTRTRVLNFKAQAAGEPELMRQAIANLDRVSEAASSLRGVTRDPKDLERIRMIVSASNGYREAMQNFLVEFRRGADADAFVLENHRSAMDHNAKLYVRNCADFLAGQQEKLTREMNEGHSRIMLAKDVMNLGNDTRVKTFKAQALRQPAMIRDAQMNFDSIEAKFRELSRITRGDKDIASIDEVKKAAAGYSAAMAGFAGKWEELQRLGKQRDANGRAMLEATEMLEQAGMKHTSRLSGMAVNKLNRASTIMGVGLLAALVLGAAIAYFTTRGIVRPLDNIIRGLTQASDEVAAASTQLSTSSQQLAEGSSQQAASLEESSSSLNEMSSMTRRNADNAEQADRLMSETTEAVERANTRMVQLVQSMEHMSNAGTETRKVIKSIDEIAFQTNLLALNAAVEAARAGEAGAGFAVVADEVRGLAMRAAEAAKETAELIDDSILRIQESAELVNQTGADFEKVATCNGDACTLVREISEASSEQAQGISQLNSATSELDTVTQQNAATAQESASASQQMSMQSRHMKDFVGELMGIIGGNSPLYAAWNAKALPAATGGGANALNVLDCVDPKDSKAAAGKALGGSRLGVRGTGPANGGNGRALGNGNGKSNGNGQSASSRNRSGLEVSPEDLIDFGEGTKDFAEF
jgi:methyl-accepting chemotaxis protein